MYLWQEFFMQPFFFYKLWLSTLLKSIHNKSFIFFSIHDQAQSVRIENLSSEHVERFFCISSKWFRGHTISLFCVKFKYNKPNSTFWAISGTRRKSFSHASNFSDWEIFLKIAACLVILDVCFMPVKCQARCVACSCCLCQAVETNTSPSVDNYVII